MDQEALEATFDERASKAPHLTTTASPVDYEVVIPTYRRWRSTQEVTKKKRFKDSSQPFILDHTLGFLSREGVPKERVTLFVANEEEAQEYLKAFEGSEWCDVRIQVSVPGVRDSRNFIYKFFPADTYVVSLDDDMEGITWKVREGGSSSCCVDLPTGNFIKIIFDAYQRMKEAGAFLWGLSTSQNPRFLVLDDVSSRNGLVNGCFGNRDVPIGWQKSVVAACDTHPLLRYLHGFICRPDAVHDLLRRLPDSVEVIRCFLCPELRRNLKLLRKHQDAEFSVRHFAKATGNGVNLIADDPNQIPIQDKVVLRYRMYAGVTSPYTNSGGLQSKFLANAGSIRKSEEWCGAQQLHELFPTLIAAPSDSQTGRQHATEVRFISQTGLGIKARRSAVRRLQGLCRFMLPQLKGKGKERKKKATLAALARLKAFAIRKKPKKELPTKQGNNASKRTSGEPGKAPQAERPLPLLGEDMVRFSPNPKKKGTDAHRRYSKYCRAKKVKDLTGNIDLRYDLKFGYLKVVELDTRPASHECVVEDEAPSTALPAVTGRARSVQVRLAEATGKHPGLYLSKESLLPLLQRCPALQGSWSLCAAKTGPLTKVSLPCFRILLHWTKTSSLVFAHSRAAELHVALQSLGAQSTAERLGDWMSKQELKFNFMYGNEGPPPEEFPALDAGKAESKPRPRKRPRSGAPPKRNEKKSAKITARLTFPKTVDTTAKSCEAEPNGCDVASPNGANVVASEMETADSSQTYLGGKQTEALPGEAGALDNSQEKGQNDPSCQIAKPQGCSMKTTASVLTLLTESKMRPNHPALISPSKSMEAVCNADVPMTSTDESRPEGSTPQIAEQTGEEIPTEQHRTDPEEGTKIQPGEHVTLVLGNQRHRQKNLRSMFASRSGA